MYKYIKDTINWTDLKYFTLFMILYTIHNQYQEVCCVKHFNLTTGMDAYMYAEHCGITKFCTPPNIKVEENLNISPCPSCSCDDMCASQGNCCPDKHMSRCVNTTIVYGSSSDNYGFIIIDTCSDESNRSLVSLCSRDVSLQSMFDLGPVTSWDTMLSYKNKYCAECNNVKSYTPWNFDVHDCRYSNFDINYYSSFSAIEAGLKEFRCDLSFFPEHFFLPTRCSMTYKIDQCNVTGLLENWDDNIEKACNHYHAPFQMFKNIFCYICNYQNAETLNLINYCSMQNDEFFHELCEIGPQTDRVTPYKNTMCRECNKIQGIQIDYHKIVQDFNLFSKRPYRTSVSLYLQDICSLPRNFIYSRLYYSIAFETLCGPFGMTDKKTNISLEYKTHYHFEQPVNISAVNISGLFERYKQYGGDGSWCHHGDGVDVDKPCSCEEDCFLYGDCCPDMLKIQYVECTDKVDGTFTSIVTKCPDWNDDHVLRYYCERSSSEADSILDTTPIYDPLTTVEYRNLFCFMCHQRYYTFDLFESTSSIFREIDLQCDNFLEVENFMPLQSTFNELQKLCKVKYFPYKGIRMTTCRNTDLHSPCQSNTNSHDELTRSIIRMCEDTGNYIYSRCEMKYQNIFCEMCDVMTNDIDNRSAQFLPIDILNTGNSCFESNIDIGGKYPYCQTCISQRYLFSVYDFMNTEEATLSDENFECNRNQYRDSIKGKCFDIHCSPGKLYKNNTCQPFLQWTTNLKYALHFEMQPRNVTLISADTVGDLLSEIGLSFRSKLKNELDQVVKDYYIATKGCTEKPEDMSNSDLQIYSSIQLYIPGLVVRHEKEKAIKDAITHPNFHITFGNLIARNLPTTFDSMDTNFCKQSSNDKYVNTNGYVFFFDKFLSCPQLSLKSPDVELINHQTNLKIPHLDRMLEASDFRVINSKDIRVCVDDFHSKSKEMSALGYSLSIFSLICSAISMVCLLATFMIYSVISQLRTLPGKNLMTLTLSLFVAHLCTLIGFQDLPGSVCMIVGCCIHYSWLVVFCSSSNCSIHMMRTFNGTLIMSSNKENSVKYRKALIVITAVPFFIVLTYCMIAYYVTDIAPYRGKRCFITDFKYLMTFLIAPIIFMCLVNMILFCITLYHIRTVPKTESNIEKRKITIIFFKLFIITGVTWLLQLIDGLFPPSLFSFIVAVMNCGQGIFIFLSYACNNHVYLMFKIYVREGTLTTQDAHETHINGSHHRSTERYSSARRPYIAESRL